jgi:hypothetical protein
MNGLEGAPSPEGLTDRVKNILLNPKSEWTRIDAEPSSIGDIYRNYVLILAAIPALAGLIGVLAFGHSLLGITYRPSMMAAVGGAVVQYLLTLAGVYVVALVIDALAPTFGATRNRVQAFKVAAYSATAAWVAGIFALLPAIAWLGILGLYSLYLLYLGLPRLMKAPADKAMGYTAVVVVAMIVVFIVIGALAAPITATFAGRGDAVVRDGPLSGTMTVPGVGAVDLGKLEDASRQMEAATQRMEAAGTHSGALDPMVLQGLLPTSLPGGFQRTEISSSSAAAAGMGGSQAEARFAKGDANLTLAITDIAAAGALAALGSAFEVKATRQTETGYERTGQVDGRMVTEQWDSAAGSGSYGVLVAHRFMVNADGSGVKVDDLKNAVAAVGFKRLEQLAR